MPSGCPPDVHALYFARFGIQFFHPSTAGGFSIPVENDKTRSRPKKVLGGERMSAIVVVTLNEVLPQLGHEHGCKRRSRIFEADGRGHAERLRETRKKRSASRDDQPAEPIAAS